MTLIGDSGGVGQMGGEGCSFGGSPAGLFLPVAQIEKVIVVV